MKAVRVTEYGGPGVMSYEDVDMPSPGGSDALVKVEASGINYIAVSYTHLTLPPICSV